MWTCRWIIIRRAEQLTHRNFDKREWTKFDLMKKIDRPYRMNSEEVSAIWGVNSLRVYIWMTMYMWRWYWGQRDNFRDHTENKWRYEVRWAEAQSIDWASGCTTYAYLTNARNQRTAEDYLLSWLLSDEDPVSVPVLVRQLPSLSLSPLSRREIPQYHVSQTHYAVVIAEKTL